MCNPCGYHSKIQIMKKVLLTLFLLALAGLSSFSQEKIWDETPEQKTQRMQWWTDARFGMFIHWGIYALPARHEWVKNRERLTNEEYQKYFEEFNPDLFDPHKWAVMAREAGMKYAVITSKHHDGFCLFDSQYTDYDAVNTPYGKDLIEEWVEAFRAEGLGVGFYYSLIDWHHPDFTVDRHHPQRTDDPEERAILNEGRDMSVYRQYLRDQIRELLTNYGKIDILWLDGGWVAKKDPEKIRNFYQGFADNASGGFLKSRSVNQDIRMDELAQKAREKQPGLIVVDRAVEGKNQNYLTPENRVPEAALPFPWESCIIAGGGWSWVPDARYKSGREAIHMLVDIVAKGGNLLLNIAPGPDGQWHDEAYDLLKEIGAWMDVNGEAIYGTRALAPYKDGKVCLTRKKDGTVYAIYLPEKNETTLPSKVWLNSIQAKQGSGVELLGYGKVKWEKSGNGMLIHVPQKAILNPPCKEAWSFKIETE